MSSWVQIVQFLPEMKVRIPDPRVFFTGSLLQTNRMSVDYNGQYSWNFDLIAKNKITGPK